MNKIVGYNNYLKNDICDFILLDKNDIYKKKRNMFTTSFFKLEKSYKNFNKYLEGLNNWIHFLNSFEHDYIFRIFIDQNIYNDKNIMKLLRSDNKIELVLFKCKNYKKGNYHIDLFSTLIRFFPYFNFDNNDSNKVIVTDIDMDLNSISLGTDPRVFYKFLMTKKDKEYFIGYGEPQKFILSEFKNKLYIYAECMYLKDKLNKKNLIDFFKNIDTIFPKWNIGYYNKRFTTYGFGIDEMFINDYLFKNFKEYSAMFQYFISYFIYMYVKHKKMIKNNNMSKNIFRYILGKYYNENMGINDMINFIDKYTYNIKEYTSINNYLTIRFNNIISYLYKKNIIWMDMTTMKLIHEHLNDVIYGTVVITTNYNIDFININVYNKIKTRLNQSQKKKSTKELFNDIDKYLN